MNLSSRPALVALLLSACSSSASPTGPAGGVAPGATNDGGTGGNIGAACVTKADCSAGPSPICLAVTSTTGDCSSTCTSDSDCPGGVCLQGLIVEGDGGVSSGCAAACSASADCGNDQLVCVNSACMLACRGDRDCAAGTTCDTSTGVCGGPHADSGPYDAAPFALDAGAMVAVDASQADAPGALAGCAFTTCPASVACGSPEGSSGTYSLTCVDLPPVGSGQRWAAACELDEGSDGDFAFTFPATYTCASATIACDWPDGGASCPASWLVPGDGGSAGVVGGCCGFLSAAATTPSCGEVVDAGCASPAPGDVAQ